LIRLEKLAATKKLGYKRMVAEPATKAQRDQYLNLIVHYLFASEFLRAGRSLHESFKALG
jgi:hypothetical protein